MFLLAQTNTAPWTPLRSGCKKVSPYAHIYKPKVYSEYKHGSIVLGDICHVIEKGSVDNYPFL